MHNQIPLQFLLLIAALKHHTVSGVKIEFALEYPALKTIHVSNAQPSTNYICTECKETLIRKETLISKRGTINQHHFAHQSYVKVLQFS